MQAVKEWSERPYLISFFLLSSETDVVDVSCQCKLHAEAIRLVWYEGNLLPVFQCRHAHDFRKLPLNPLTGESLAPTG